MDAQNNVGPLSLAGRRALVVGGGGGGIGTAMVETLAGAGAAIAAITIDADHAADTKARVRALGVAAEVEVADVTNDVGFAAAIEAVTARIGGVDLLVNVVGGAGVNDWSRARDYELEMLDRIVARNLRYAVASCRSVAAALIDAGQPGAIVNVSSVATRSVPLLMGYGAAKAALEAATRTMASEWGPYGVRVNAVAPGTVKTPRAGQDDLSDAVKSIPLQRRGTPADIANAAWFLLSDLADHITGQTLTVDGGGSLGAAGDKLPVFVTNPAIRAKFD